MAGKKVHAFLIYRASDQTLRTVRRRPTLEWDEVMFEVTVNVPDPWGRLAGAIVVDLPENGPAVIEITPAEVND